MSDSWLDEVAELMQVIHDRGDVDYLELIKGDLQIRFSRNDPAGRNGFAALPGDQIAGMSVRQATVSVGDVAAHETSRDAPSWPGSVSAQPSNSSETPEEREGSWLVCSPMVGTFYRAPAPNSPPFVEIGATVAADSTMGLVEAMKVFTAINSGGAGVVEEIFVESGEFVEFDQPLFRVILS